MRQSGVNAEAYRADAVGVPLRQRAVEDIDRGGSSRAATTKGCGKGHRRKAVILRTAMTRRGRSPDVFLSSCHSTRGTRRPASGDPDTMVPSKSTKLCALSLLAAILLAASAQTQPTPSIAGSGEAADKAAIDDLVLANRVLAEQGVLDAFGHVSVRHPGNPQRFLMSRALAPALVKAEDIRAYDLDGNALDPKGPTSFPERFIHSEIYRARPDVTAVVHSHAPAVIAFGTTQIPLRPITLSAAFLPPRVPVFEIRRVAGITSMLVSNPQLGRALAATLGANSVALMRGHGMVVAASTLPLAVYRAVYTMIDARLEADAISLGGLVTFLEPEEAESANKMLDQIHLRAWELWRREAEAHLCK